MPSSVEITQDLLERVSRLPASRRRKAYREIGEIEFAKCAEDIFYWLDASQHPLLGPYVYTRDRPMYQCLKCSDSAAYNMAVREKHLEFRHKTKVTSEAELRGYFLELDTTRAFPFYQPYIRPIIEWWLREPIMLIEKSRDMTATWLIVACYTWDTLYHKGRENVFQSDDSTKTLDLVDRADFIYRNQPKFLRDIHKASMAAGVSKAGRLTVPSLESVILGFPQGPDQIRQYHPHGVFTDETAFQVSAGDSFAALKPAIQNGGRYTGVSSPNPGWFQFACRDTLDALSA